MAAIEPLKNLDDDGLPIPEVGIWGEDKYRHVRLYALRFIKSMRGKGLLAFIWIYLQVLGEVKHSRDNTDCERVASFI